MNFDTGESKRKDLSQLETKNAFVAHLHARLPAKEIFGGPLTPSQEKLFNDPFFSNAIFEPIADAWLQKPDEIDHNQWELSAVQATTTLWRILGGFQVHKKEIENRFARKIFTHAAGMFMNSLASTELDNPNPLIGIPYRGKLNAALYNLHFQSKNEGTDQYPDYKIIDKEPDIE